MSRSSKIILGIVIALLVAGGAWWYLGNKNASAPTPQTAETSPGAGAPTPLPPGAQPGTAVVMNGTSDASLDQGLSNIDAQLNGLNSDSAQADQGMNDKPIPQN